jgi:hypothetical protein
MFEIFAATDNKTFTTGISCGRMEFSRLILEKKTEKSGMPHIIHYSTSNRTAEVSKKNYTWKGKSFAKFYNHGKTERKSRKKKRKNCIPFFFIPRFSIAGSLLQTQFPNIVIFAFFD